MYCLGRERSEGEILVAWSDVLVCYGLSFQEVRLYYVVVYLC